MFLWFLDMNWVFREVSIEPIPNGNLKLVIRFLVTPATTNIKSVIIPLVYLLTLAALILVYIFFFKLKFKNIRFVKWKNVVKERNCISLGIYYLLKWEFPKKWMNELFNRGRCQRCQGSTPIDLQHPPPPSSPSPHEHWKHNLAKGCQLSSYVDLVKTFQLCLVGGIKSPTFRMEAKSREIWVHSRFIWCIRYLTLRSSFVIK
jgi:hypothetical protein